MAVFQYKARNGSGQTVTGRIEGTSAEAVAGQLFRSEEHTSELQSH